MLVTKRFYCLFPLVFSVFYSTMFSMVQAPPMENLAGHKDNPWDSLGRLAQGIGEVNTESYGYGSNDALQKDTGDLSDIVNHVTNPVASSSHHLSPPDKVEKAIELTADIRTKDELLNLVTEIQQYKPPSKRQIITINEKHSFYQFDNIVGTMLLERFFEKYTPTSRWVDNQDFTDVIPIFIIDKTIYFVAKSKNEDGFRVFTKSLGYRFSLLYGGIEPGLTVEIIKDWAKQNQLSRREKPKSTKFKKTELS